MPLGSRELVKDLHSEVIRGAGGSDDSMLRGIAEAGPHATSVHKPISRRKL